MIVKQRLPDKGNAGIFDIKKNTRRGRVYEIDPIGGTSPRSSNILGTSPSKSLRASEISDGNGKWEGRGRNGAAGTGGTTW